MCRTVCLYLYVQCIHIDTYMCILDLSGNHSSVWVIGGSTNGLFLDAGRAMGAVCAASATTLHGNAGTVSKSGPGSLVLPSPKGPRTPEKRGTYTILHIESLHTRSLCNVEQAFSQNSIWSLGRSVDLVSQVSIPYSPRTRPQNPFRPFRFHTSIKE